MPKYIDADMLMRHMKTDPLFPLVERYGISGVIESFPAADVVKRKNGKWIVYYECPKCGEITKDFMEYCPFCNADLRGEEKEDE